MGNTNIYMGLACLTYAVLLLCISGITTWHNRKHQWWKREDDVEIRDKEENEKNG